MLILYLPPYRGVESRETDTLQQMTEIGTRLNLLLSAVKSVNDQMAQATVTLTASGHKSSKDTASLSLIGGADASSDTIVETREMRLSAHASNKSMNRPIVEEVDTEVFNGLGTNSCEKGESRRRRVGSRPGDPHNLRCTRRSNLPLSFCDGVSKQNCLPPTSMRGRISPFRSVNALSSDNGKNCLLPGASLSIGGSRNLRKDLSLEKGEEKNNFFPNENDSLLFGYQNPAGLGRDKTIRAETQRKMDHNILTAKLTAMKRATSLPLLRAGNFLSDASHDRSSNKSICFSHRLAPQAKTLASDPNAPAKNSCYSKQSKTPRPPINDEVSDFTASLSSSSRMSYRMRKRIHNKERLYYIKTTPTLVQSATCLGVWDDGVYLGPLPSQNTIKTELGTMGISKLKPVKSKQTTKKSGLQVDAQCHTSGEAAEQTSGGQIPAFPLPSKTFAKKSSAPNKTVAKKDVAYAKKIANKDVQSYSTKNLHKPKSSTLTRQSSTGYIGGRVRLKSLNHSTSNSTTDKSSGRKRQSSNNVPKAETTTVKKSYLPSLRRPRLPQQRWQYAYSSQKSTPSSLSIPSPVVRNNTASSSSETQSPAFKVWRSRYRDQKLKRDCLTFLANVKLGSRWPEELQPEDLKNTTSLSER
ncbi:hypothetical protein PoB_006019700 [Plakobranchus ocellatus]|uniref:Uncharacterized protein n=1 Tax=Plakobranchus ocellatus TaxID=259542 RepID=A0AAV4CP73_9GAST|nr:hypothetical protein PoB_006019700 [Plakobranchus ocellatus]